MCVRLRLEIEKATWTEPTLSNTIWSLQHCQLHRPPAYAVPPSAWIHVLVCGPGGDGADPAPPDEASVAQAQDVLPVLIDPLVPAEDAALIAGVPPELLPPAEGPVPDRPRWAGRPPKRREQGDSYRWLSYQAGCSPPPRGLIAARPLTKGTAAVPKQPGQPDRHDHS